MTNETKKISERKILLYISYHDMRNKAVRVINSTNSSFVPGVAIGLTY